MMAELPEFEALGNGQVLLRGRYLRAVVTLAEERARQIERRDGGLPPELAELVAALRSAAVSGTVPGATLSGAGQPDTPGPVDVPSSAMSVSEAAEVLGMHERRVRRSAQDLGGERVGGRWLFSRDRIAAAVAARNDVSEVG